MSKYRALYAIGLICAYGLVAYEARGDGLASASPSQSPAHGANQIRSEDTPGSVALRRTGRFGYKMQQASLLLSKPSAPQAMATPKLLESAAKGRH